MSKLNQNTTTLQELIEIANNLPEADSGGELPELSNEASASELLIGKELINSSGEVVAGTMANNGAISSTMDGLTTKTVTVPAGYTSGGTVSLDDTIDNEVSDQAVLIGQIKTALANKTAVEDIQLPTLTNEGSASDMLAGKQLINSNNEVVTGIIETKTSNNLTASGATITVPIGYYAEQATKSVSSATQATPSISVSSSGLITASSTQTAGYVSAGTKSATKQLTTQAAQTITPSTSNKTAIASGVYTTGAITVAGDANLVPANIAEGVSIFGVEGTHTGGGGTGINVETCTVIFTNYTGSAPTITELTENGINSRILNISSRVFNVDNILVGSYIIGLLSPKISGAIVKLHSENSGYSAYPALRIDGNGTITNNPCFVSGTKIMLFNNSTKPVQDITYDDNLLVWDFDNGCYASAKPLWIKKTQTTASYYRCKFADGTVLKLVGSNGNCHRVFSIEDGAFIYATECVGKQIMTINGPIALISCELIEEETEFYNIITDYHLNLFAEGILTSCRLNNIYPIIDMKFIKDDRQIRPYEAYRDIDIKFYKGLRLGEQTNDIEMLNKYISRLYTLKS